MTEFQINDPSLESQWRALILFGKNKRSFKGKRTISVQAVACCTYQSSSVTLEASASEPFVPESNNLLSLFEENLPEQ